MIVGDQTVTPHQVCPTRSVLLLLQSKVNVLCTIPAGKCTSPMDLIGYDDCNILYYIILYYIILYYIILYYIILYYIIL